MSSCFERCGALPRALQCAREALRIRQAALPPGHNDVADAESRVRELEQGMREAGIAAHVEAAAASDGRHA